MKTIIVLLGFLILMASCQKNVTESTPCIDKSLINPGGACTMDYRPVCGCDGKTYSNSCVAKNSGVTSFKDGECAK